MSLPGVRFSINAADMKTARSLHSTGIEHLPLRSVDNERDQIQLPGALRFGPFMEDVEGDAVVGEQMVRLGGAVSEVGHRNLLHPFDQLLPGGTWLPRGIERLIEDGLRSLLRNREE